MGLYDVNSTMSKYGLCYKFAGGLHDNFSPIVFENNLVVTPGQVSDRDEHCTEFWNQEGIREFSFKEFPIDQQVHLKGTTHCGLEFLAICDMYGIAMVQFLECARNEPVLARGHVD